MHNQVYYIHKEAINTNNILLLELQSPPPKAPLKAPSDYSPTW